MDDENPTLKAVQIARLYQEETSRLVSLADKLARRAEAEPENRAVIVGIARELLDILLDGRQKLDSAIGDIVQGHEHE